MPFWQCYFLESFYTDHKTLSRLNSLAISSFYGGCQLPYIEFEQNNLWRDLSQRAEGASENFLGIPNFFPEIRKIVGNSENFGNSSDEISSQYLSQIVC